MTRMQLFRYKLIQSVTMYVAATDSRSFKFLLALDQKLCIF